jgi:hypothetical protein
MAGIDEVTLFEAGDHKHQRSIVFAIVVATAFLALVAGVITVANGVNPGLGIGLLVVGFGLLGGSAAVATGMVDEALFER